MSEKKLKRKKAIFRGALKNPHQQNFKLYPIIQFIFMFLKVKNGNLDSVGFLFVGVGCIASDVCFSFLFFSSDTFVIRCFFQWWISRIVGGCRPSSYAKEICHSHGFEALFFSNRNCCYQSCDRCCKYFEYHPVTALDYPCCFNPDYFLCGPFLYLH